MTSKARTDLLTTTEMYHLDQACQLVSRALAETLGILAAVVTVTVACGLWFPPG